MDTKSLFLSVWVYAVIYLMVGRVLMAAFLDEHRAIRESLLKEKHSRRLWLESVLSARLIVDPTMLSDRASRGLRNKLLMARLMLLLLPVYVVYSAIVLSTQWLGPPTRRQMLHHIAVNGRTGETMGSVPVQQWKLLLAAITTGTFLEAIAIAMIGMQ